MKKIKSFLDNLLKKKHIIPILLFLFTFLVFNIGFRYQSTGDVRPNELLPISLIYERDFDFNEFVDGNTDSLYWFQNNNGKILSNYPIVPGLLNLPVHLIAFIFGVNLLENNFLLSTISASWISSLSVAFMYLCLVKICRKRRNAVLFALIYSFATPVFSTVSRGTWQHAPSLLFLTISLLILLSKNKHNIPYSGFFLGMVLFNRPSNIMIILPLIIYTFFEYREQFKKYILFMAVPLIFMSLYIADYWHPTSLSIELIYPIENQVDFRGNFFSGLLGQLISPSRGVLIYTPLFIFSFIFLFYSLISKKIDLIYKYLAISAIFLILVFSWKWWAGWTFGYRYLIELIPLLIIFLAFFYERVIQKNKYLKIIFMLFLFISMYIHFLGAYYYPCGFDYFPNDINHNTERLWHIKDSQIILCTKKMLHSLDSYNLEESENIMLNLYENYSNLANSS